MIYGRMELAKGVADAVLYEGYALYPYRKSALKNHHRWQFGVVAPPRWAAAGAEPSHAQSECVIQAGGRPRLTVIVRFLQLQVRTVEEPAEGATDRWRACASTTVDGDDLLSWEEAVPCEVTRSAVPLDPEADEHRFQLEISGAREVELVPGSDGAPAARIVRERFPMSFTLCVRTRSQEGMLQLTLRVENTTELPTIEPLDRGVALRHSLLACHALIGVEEGEFVSLLDPPPHAIRAVEACENDRWWPVLVGPEASRDVMLCAPIILYDHPAIAPESAGDFFDATEIDEMLTLRILTLTDLEKREISATDERARHILERVENTRRDEADRLHGAIRHLAEARDPMMAGSSWETLLNPPGEEPPEQASVMLGSERLERGSRVRLEPRAGADAMDMFLRGRVATVEAVHRDLEGRTYLAVTVEDDPGADLRRELGRGLFYFSPQDVVPLGPQTRVHDAD